MKHRHIAVGFAAIATYFLLAGFAIAQDAADDQRVAIPVSASPADGSGLVIQPRVTVGYEYYEFDSEGDGGIEVDSRYLIGGAGLTVQAGRFFADIYGQTNLTDADYDEDDFIDDVNVESEIERFNINLALGYAILPSVSVIGGVKYARSEIESDFVSDDAVVAANLGNSFLDIDVEYVGPYFGGAYALPVADLGSLVLSGSVAYLYGETTVDSELLGVVVADNQTIEGQSIGANIGLAWSGGLAPLSTALAGVGYSLGVDYSAYEFKDDDVDVFSEKTVRGKFDLKYRF